MAKPLGLSMGGQKPQVADHLQQPTPSKCRILIVVGFKLGTLCLLLGHTS